MSIVTYGLGQNGDTIDYAVVMGFGVVTLFPFDQPAFYTYYIPEEIRLCAILNEVRNLNVVEDVRANSIKFENRTTIVPYKEEE